jgi:carboxypeptidase C (cathepsin A)
MNFRAIILTTIIGISTPVITAVAFSNLVSASPSFNHSKGKFSDGNWSMALEIQKKGYRNNRKNLQKGKNLKVLGKAEKSGNQQKQAYTSSRRNLRRYQLAFRPNDPNFIRLRVFNSEGKIILNTSVDLFH